MRNDSITVKDESTMYQLGADELSSKQGLCYKCTRTKNKKLGITMCIILTILLVLLIFAYINIDDLVPAEQTIEEQVDQILQDEETVAPKPAPLTEEQLEEQKVKAEAEMIYNAYNLEPPQTRSGDSEKCKMQLQAAFEEAVQVATRELEISLAYNNICQ